MNSKTVLSKILGLLSKTEVELTYAKLADGTIVESATFDVGEDLFVVSEDGTKTPAPNGEHELALKDTEGNETLIKVMTEDGKIVERENVELEMVPTKEITEEGNPTEVDKMPEVPGEIKSGTLKAAEVTEEVAPLVEDEEKPMDEEPTIEIELGKKLENMAYRIEEMEARIAKCEAMVPPVDEKVAEEVAMESEEEELPKLDGAPTEDGVKFSSTNSKNYGKKVTDSQSNFLSKLYK